MLGPIYLWDSYLEFSLSPEIVFKLGLHVYVFFRERVHMSSNPQRVT